MLNFRLFQHNPPIAVVWIIDDRKSRSDASNTPNLAAEDSIRALGDHDGSSMRESAAILRQSGLADALEHPFVSRDQM
jgi:hypothetical protein